MKTCTYCGKEYPDEASVCTIDQQPLQSEPLQSVITTPPALIEAQKQSTLGIASFGISIAVGVLMFTMFIIGSLQNAGRIERGQTYPGQTIIGLVVIFLLAVDVVGVGLGIAALCQSGRKRLLGILGLVFSSGTILGSIGLIILGLVYTAKHTR